MHLWRPFCAVGFVVLIPMTVGAEKPAPGVYSISFEDQELIYRLTQGDPDIDVAGIDCEKVNGITKGRSVVECDIEIDGEDVEGDLSGTIETEVFRTDSGETKIKFKAEFEGELDVEGDDFDAEIVLKGGGKVQPGDPLVSLDASIELCVDGFCFDDTQQVVVPIATGNGAWTLDLTLVEKAGEKIRGDAVVSFADGKKVVFDAAGEHDPETGLSTIALSPRNGKPGLKLKLKRLEVVGDDIEGRLKYKLFGHQHGANALLEGTPDP
jgi:hypothetical protein